MWIKFKFPTDNDCKRLLAVISPTDGKIYFDADGVAKVIKSTLPLLSDRDFDAAVRQAVRVRSVRFASLTYGHPIFRRYMGREIARCKVLSAEMVGNIFYQFTSTQAMAHVFSSNFVCARTFNLANDWFDRYECLWDFMNKNNAVVLDVYPYTQDSDQDEDGVNPPTVREVLNEIRNCILQIYDLIENNENV